MAEYSFQAYLEGFSQKSDKILRHFYQVHRPKIIKSLLKRYQVDEEKVKDAFQNSMIEVFTRIRLGKVKDVGATFSTYFYSVCNNQLLKILRKKDESLITISEHMVYTSGKDSIENPEYKTIDNERVENEQKILNLVKELRKEAGTNCEDAFRLRFEKRMKMQEIEKLLGYSEGGGRLRIHRCLRKLRKLLKGDPRYRSLRNLSDWGWDL